MKILYLTTVLPSQRRTGGEIASQCFIDTLQQLGNEVLVIGYQRKDSILKKKQNEIAVSQRYIETDRAKFYPFFWIFLSLFKNLPYSSEKYYSHAYIKKIKLVLSRKNCDLVIIDHAQLCWLTPLITEKIQVIFIAHNIEHEIYLEHLKHTRNYLLRKVYEREAELIKKMENNLAKTAKQIWTLTPHDHKYFSSLNQATKVFSLPPSSNVSSTKSVNKTCDVGMIGNWTWKANASGLEWFFQAVYPYLPPDLSIQIAGLGAEDLQGKYSNVKYCGFVPDAQAFMTEAKIIAIPSIAGGGIQIKTLDAIANGSLIVATPVALRGISEHPSFVKVAETPEEFAHSVVELLASNTASNFCEEALAKLRQERLTWLQNRREQFLKDIASALNILGS